MINSQQAFIELALRYDVLRFGQFTLKSGRISPYFFNAGLFNNGAALQQLGELYAARLVESRLSFDMVFGPAYKGIPLVSATAIALASHYSKNVPYSFNRKEVKDHGEGGHLVGAPVAGQRVIIIDDVMTAGTAVKEALQLLTAAKANVVGILIALDRQEHGQGANSAVQEVQARYNIPVLSIITLADIIHFVQNKQQLEPATLTALQAYRADYGIN